MADYAPTRDPQLGLFEQRPGDVNVRWLDELLQGAKTWMTAKDIALTSGGRVCDRDIRALASASEWIISGQKGYKHLEHATAEENAHAANWLISQGKLMIQRGCRIRKNAHRRIG
jgi:hypothetical protein